MEFLRLVWVPLFLLFVLPGSILAQERPVVLAHYMPWFNSKEVSGEWGWHWKLKNQNPENLIGDKRDIASHYYPLMGPYDSSDPEVLECHVLLMKIAGIDGVIIDWYGIKEHWDYGVNHKNTLAMIRAIKKAKLRYAICYEDQTVAHLIQGKKVNGSDGIEHGLEVMRYLADNCFPDASYVRINSRPLLLVFGPQFFADGKMKEICDSVTPSPLLYALPHLVGKANADGAFGWPPVSGGKEIHPEKWNDYLDQLYLPKSEPRRPIATVFSQFHDFYQEGEGRPSFGSISSQAGKTMATTIQRAWESEAEVIQIATWNDFGEGTMIEPTRELGYQCLEAIQNQVYAFDAARLKTNRSALGLPIRLYQLQKLHAKNKSIAGELERVSQLLFEEEYETAAEQIRRLESLNR
jgi:hypothetical protein